MNERGVRMVAHRVRVPKKTGAELGAVAFVGCSLLVRRDPDTERWVVSLVSRSSREDVPVAWKATEADALAWAANYGVRK